MNYLFGIEGRISRGKWWLAQLINFALVILVYALVYNKTGQVPESSYDLFVASSNIPEAAVPLVFVIWINFAVAVKRFHDRDKSGLWVFVFFIPVIGLFWQIIECGALAGTPGTNRFGPEPGNTPKPSRDRAQSASAQRLQQVSANRVHQGTSVPSTGGASFLGRNRVETGKPTFGRRSV
ncbi:MAG: DUF805 domain-containing protein [Pseudomonadota bacterium]